MKADAVISGTITALVTQQVYRQIQVLNSSVSPPLMYRGPAKSTPVYVNGGACVSLKLGSGGGGGPWNGHFLQTTHRCMSCLPSGDVHHISILQSRGKAASSGHPTNQGPRASLIQSSSAACISEAGMLELRCLSLFTNFKTQAVTLRSFRNVVLTVEESSKI